MSVKKGDQDELQRVKQADVWREKQSRVQENHPQVHEELQDAGPSSPWHKNIPVDTTKGITNQTRFFFDLESIPT